MSAAVAKVAVLPFNCMSTYRASSHFGGDSYEENTTKGSQVLLDIVGVIASIIRTMVSLVRLVYDITKDRKQKSNRLAKD